MQAKELIEEILQQAVQKRISDIFFLPKSDCYQLAFREDSGVEVVRDFKRQMGIELINYFKYAAQMDIAEHRRPQVGAMNYCNDKTEYYLRLSSLGDFDDQESLVIRIIYQTDQSSYFFAEQLQQIVQFSRKRGLIVTSGPTGSGKTTTMYEIAKKIGAGKIVMTIEDPVEVHESSFLQAQINNEAGINYQSLLKAALRHRPDILIIGEIRDSGTARLAIDAALSGHLVLATVHAKSTLQTITRLEGLGIRNDELANCLTAVSYQRLLPKNGSGFSCLMDIAGGQVLQDNLMSDVRGEFVLWQENIIKLKEEGAIDEYAYSFFKEG